MCSAMSNTCIKLHSSIELHSSIVIKDQLSVPADEIENNWVISFIFSKPQKEKSEFKKVSKHSTF